MADYHLGEIESIFADIIWSNAPLTSRLLAELAEQRPSGAPAREPEPAPSHDASDVIWRGDAGTELVAEINGRRYIALPAKLRRPSHCSRNIGGQEYVIFPAPSCKNGDNSV